MRDPIAGAALGGQNDGVDRRNLERWSFDIRVAIRGLESNTSPVAAVAQAVEMEELTPNLEAPGPWHAGRDLRRGDSDSARVYVPDPSARELAAVAPAAYPRAIVENLNGSELEQVLRGAGISFTRGDRLSAVASRLPEGARRYVSALREGRYGGGPGPPDGDRRSLRRALSAGRGPLGRARI